jgi:hypothetical protein
MIFSIFLLKVQFRYPSACICILQCKSKPEHQMSGIPNTRPTKAWVLLNSLGPLHSRFCIQNWDGSKAKCSVCLQQISQHHQCIWYAKYIKLANTSRMQTTHQNHHDIQMCTSTCCDIIRHNPYTSWLKNQENSPTNFNVHIHFKRHIQIFLLSIHS